jgi:hypothetical protein
LPANSEHTRRGPLQRQCSHARTSRSTTGSVECERQLEVAIGLASTQVFAGGPQALGARFGDEWAPARPAAEARSSPNAGPASRRASTLGCLRRVASAAPPPSSRWPGPKIRLSRSECRHCDSALPAGARRKGIVAMADAARSRPVEGDRAVEAVLAAQLKPDGCRSRLLSRRSRASTDATVHRHGGPADGRHSPRSVATASPGEAVASSPRAPALPQLVRSRRQLETGAHFCSGHIVSSDLASTPSRRVVAFRAEEGRGRCRREARPDAIARVRPHQARELPRSPGREHRRDHCFERTYDALPS